MTARFKTVSRRNMTTEDNKFINGSLVQAKVSVYENQQEKFARAVSLKKEMQKALIKRDKLNKRELRTRQHTREQIRYLEQHSVKEKIEGLRKSNKLVVMQMKANQISKEI